MATLIEPPTLFTCLEGMRSALNTAAENRFPGSREKQAAASFGAEFASGYLANDVAKALRGVRPGTKWKVVFDGLVHFILPVDAPTFPDRNPDEPVCRGEDVIAAVQSANLANHIVRAHNESGMPQPE